MLELDPDGQITVGSVLNETYQIQALIGRGGVGSVWSASHLRLPGKRVAVKVIHTGSLGDEVYLRFRREAEVATRIGHPNIVEVLDWNTLPGGTPYMVLEYLQGESLAARLVARGRLPLDMTLGIVRQLGSALAAAHRAGVVHRDLKPDNIFICPTDMGGTITDRVKVLDFGISKIRNSMTLQTQDARLIGTPQYMSPEQASGKNALVDQRTDIFALGTIIYEMLAGKSPFSGESVVTAVFQVVFEEPPALASLVPGLPPNVLAAVAKAMAKDPEKRHPDMGAFVADLTGRPLDSATPAGAAGAHIDPLAATANDFMPLLPVVPPIGTPAPHASPGKLPPLPSKFEPMSPSPASRSPGIAHASPTTPSTRSRRGHTGLYALLGVLALGGGGVAIWRTTAAGVSAPASQPIAAMAMPPTPTPSSAPIVASANAITNPASTPGSMPAPNPAPTSAPAVATVNANPTPTATPTSAPAATPTSAPVAAITPPAAKPKPAIPPPEPDEHANLPDLIDAQTWPSPTMTTSRPVQARASQPAGTKDRAGVHVDDRGLLRPEGSVERPRHPLAAWHRPAHADASRVPQPWLPSR